MNARKVNPLLPRTAHLGLPFTHLKIPPKHFDFMWVDSDALSQEMRNEAPKLLPEGWVGARKSICKVSMLVLWQRETGKKGPAEEEVGKK